MDILQILQSRSTAKHYSGRIIPRDDFKNLLESLRLAPTSVNSQPTKFFIASSAAAKEKLLEAIPGFNAERIKGASDVIVFAIPDGLSDAHMRRINEKERADGRFAEEKFAKAEDEKRRAFAASKSPTLEDALCWEGKQAYIALGFLLLSAAAMGIDATPIEGADFAKMDEILGLRAKGLRSIVAASVGYRAENDANARRPKSRLAPEEVFFDIQ